MDSTAVSGFSGKTERLLFTSPLLTQVGTQTFRQQYLFSPACPVNLMGRDMLQTMGAVILCGPLGLQVTLRDGTILHCNEHVMYSSKNMLLQSEQQPPTFSAEIFWGLLQPETPEKGGIFSLFQLWKPWIAQLAPYAPPADPLHVTLNYLREPDDLYTEAFESELAGGVCHIASPCLFVGKEGVVAAVT